mmetsp:Transcript_12921/g.35769  ORF Transcript_12921/g.35769 Transcript_12921/m.35769 type:complete len:208 (-) Transcript_12921:230-853(-)
MLSAESHVTCENVVHCPVDLEACAHGPPEPLAAAEHLLDCLPELQLRRLRDHLLGERGRHLQERVSRGGHQPLQEAAMLGAQHAGTLLLRAAHCSRNRVALQVPEHQQHRRLRFGVLEAEFHAADDASFASAVDARSDARVDPDNIQVANGSVEELLHRDAGVCTAADNGRRLQRGSAQALAEDRVHVIDGHLGAINVPLVALTELF